MGLLSLFSLRIAFLATIIATLSTTFDAEPIAAMLDSENHIGDGAGHHFAYWSGVQKPRDANPNMLLTRVHVAGLRRPFGLPHIASVENTIYPNSGDAGPLENDDEQRLFDNLGFDVISTQRHEKRSDTESNHNGASALIIFSNHKRANLLKLANQAARGFGK